MISILELLNERQLERLSDKWWTNNANKATCAKFDAVVDDEEDDALMSMPNLVGRSGDTACAYSPHSGMAIVLSVGLLVSLLSLVVECCCCRRRPVVLQKTHDYPPSVNDMAFELKPY